MSDDPAVRAAAQWMCDEAAKLEPGGGGLNWRDFEPEARGAVEAARPIIEAEKDQEIHAERLLHRLQESRLREGKGPRWDDDPIVLENGWDEGRCGACGEHLPKPAAKPGGNR